MNLRMIKQSKFTRKYCKVSSFEGCPVHFSNPDHDLEVIWQSSTAHCISERLANSLHIWNWKRKRGNYLVFCRNTCSLYGRNDLFGENAITSTGFGGSLIGYEGSLSCFKVQGNFLLLCSSTNFVGYSHDVYRPAISQELTWNVQVDGKLILAQEVAIREYWHHLTSTLNFKILEILSV